MQVIFKRTVFVFIFVLIAGTASSQDLLTGPATSVMDSKSIFANPALISFHPSQFSIGVKGFHTGFFDNSAFTYKQGFFTVSTPTFIGSRIGSGVQVQYFDSPIFSRTEFGGSVSAQILRRISIGANISLLNLGFNTDNFVDFDFNDPVFEDGFSRWALNTHAGIFVRPTSDFEVAAGARNINEPNLSLIGDGANEPMELFAAVSYRFGILKGIFELVNGRYGVQNRTHLKLFSTQGYYARIGANSNFDNGYIEAQARLFEGFGVNYQFELPMNELAGNTNGSHLISIVYHFGRLPDMPEKRSAPGVYSSIQRPEIAPQIPSAIVLSSDTDHLRYHEINLFREIDEATVTERDLSSLSLYDIGRLVEEPDFSKIPYRQRKVSEAPIPETVDLTSSISDQYRHTLELLKHKLNERSVEGLQILINEGGEIRAAGLRNLLREEQPHPVTVGNFLFTDPVDSTNFETGIDRSFLQDEQIINLDPEVALIRPIIIEALSVAEWELRIYDENQSIVRRIAGTSRPPEFIEWNWLDDSGAIINPGLYTYDFHWIDQNGIAGQSMSRNLYVQKIERNITIDITKDINKILSDPDNIDVILKNK